MTVDEVIEKLKYFKEKYGSKDIVISTWAGDAHIRIIFTFDDKIFIETEDFFDKD